MNRFALVGAHLAHRLRFAVPLRHRFDEISEEHSEPEPGRDLAREIGRAIVREEIAHEKDCNDRRNELR
jgi:hypothetical protein